MPMSSDPKARARSMANLKRGGGVGKGAQVALKNGTRAKLPVGDIASARQELQEALADAAPLRDPDGNLPKADAVAIEVVAAALARYKHMQEYLERVGAFSSGGKLRFTLVRELRRSEKQLLAELHELGLTPRGRAALGLDLARTDVEMKKVVPVRTAERAKAIGALIARSGGAIYPDEDPMDIDEQQKEHDEPETIPHPRTRGRDPRR